MFLGQYQHSLDEKGRLTIPAAYRAQLGEGSYITQGFDRCLMVMTNTYFQSVMERLNAMNITDPATRLLKRLVLSTAYQVEMDKAGRILLPPKPRQFLALQDEASLVGQGEYFEIWTPADWALQIENLQDAEANAQRFAMLDLSTNK
ncbi:MAG TPA: division/cell wall cluster transcriptional repressor MraZ [Anaerolineales bacterium]|jgi:MraZ protein